MLNDKTRNLNDRLTRRDWNRVIHASRRQRVISGSPGLDVLPEAGGTVIRIKDEMRPRWVFVIAFDGDIVLCKEGVPIAGQGWRLPTSNDDIIRARLGPNYTAAHFERFLISGEQHPGPTDQACLLIGGYIVPHYRFKLVEPPDPAECAECT